MPAPPCCSCMERRGQQGGVAGWGRSKGFQPQLPESRKLRRSNYFRLLDDGESSTAALESQTGAFVGKSSVSCYQHVTKIGRDKDTRGGLKAVSLLFTLR